MSMGKAEAVLAEAVVRIQAAGLDWKKFVEALSLVAEETTRECIEAQPGALPTAQGRAQQMNRLLKMIEDAPLTVQRVAQRKPLP